MRSFMMPGVLAMVALLGAMAEGFVVGAHHHHNAHAVHHQQVRDLSSATNVTKGFPITIHHNLTQDTGVRLYLTGNLNGKAFILQNRGGAGFQPFYPQASTNTTPVAIDAKLNQIVFDLTSEAKQMKIEVPQGMTSGRLYVSMGDLEFAANPPDPNNTVTLAEPDPNNAGNIASKTVWSFIEFSFTDKGGFAINLSNVDWVSAILGFTLNTKGGEKKTVPGFEAGGPEAVCKGLEGLGSFWPKLCVRDASGKMLRAMSPNQYATIHAGDDHDATTYYDDYVERVWDEYKDKPLKINTQSTKDQKKTEDGMIINCTLNGDMFNCDNEAGNFSKPSTREIWACAGIDANPTAMFRNDGNATYVNKLVKPRLCAAFVRSTLLLPGGDTQPSKNITGDMYYSDKITSEYAKLVHKHLQQGRGYAFPYDDVNPSAAENAAGLIQVDDPESVDVFVNG